MVCFLTSWSSSSALLRGAPTRRRIGRTRHTLSIIWCVWWKKKIKTAKKIGVEKQMVEMVTFAD